MNDTISTRKIPENTQLRLLFSPGIFLVEMTSFLFLSQHRDTQAIFYLLNTNIYIYIYCIYKALYCLNVLIINNYVFYNFHHFTMNGGKGSRNLIIFIFKQPQKIQCGHQQTRLDLKLRLSGCFKEFLETNFSVGL